VITQEDIRRSGHTNIPDLLRMVPGASVCQPTPKSFNVGIRGDESQFSRGLLVLVDGRTVYTTAFNGTFWDEVDMPMEDIDHIEVIRGPGAAVWGANAVQGVINIIRKAPEQSAGTATSVLIGNENRLITSLRHGGSAGSAAYRFSGRYVNRDSARARDDSKDQHDDYRHGVSSMRVDLRPSPSDHYTAQADWYSGDRSGQFRRDLDGSGFGAGLLQSFETHAVRGGNGLVRFERNHSETAASEFQMYMDYRYRDILIVEDTRIQYDAEFRNRFALGSRNLLNWGFGTRHIQERLGQSLNFLVEPEKQDEAIHNVFLQDEFKLTESVRFTVGSKFEYNTYTGWEVQPTGRALWHISDAQQAWASISRAVRMPSRLNTPEYQVIPAYVGGIPFKFQSIDDFESEVLVDTEVGYRIQPRPNLYFDFTTFVNRIQNWQAARGLPPTLGNISLTQQLDDFSELSAMGAEATLRWNPLAYWKLALTWSHIHISSSQDVFSFSGKDSVPPHQFTLLSYLDLPANLELDFGVYYHGRKGNNLNLALGDKLSAYTRHDLRLAWRPSTRFEISVVGQNLFNRLHNEGADFFEGSTFITGQPQSAVERSVYGQVSMRF